MSGSWDAGKRVAGAAALAVERVNADKTLLPGRRLEYSWADSGCSAKRGLAAMGGLLGGAIKVDAVIGPMQLCVRGDELPLCWTAYPADQLLLPRCLAIRQGQPPPGEIILSVSRCGLVSFPSGSIGVQPGRAL